VNEKSSDPIPPELQVSVDTEILITGLDSPLEHQKLEAALVDLPGIESLSFLEGKVAIRYDPEEVTLAHLRESITQAGFQITDVECGPASPSAPHS
jgi:hypothetical protein